jgi:hypothetical protein
MFSKRLDDAFLYAHQTASSAIHGKFLKNAGRTAPVT